MSRTNGLDSKQRRALAQSLTRILDASVEEALAGLADAGGEPARRLGMTGPPGAGKSTLICRLAARRLERDRRIGVLAIDPTSPVSQGSILGDRVRMETVAEHPALYVRSVPSRRAHDGLCDNIADLLLTMEGFGFDDLVVETVGVGQAEFAVRSLVDTVVLVLVPESGDTIQAMKAGILETADIIVVNKADLPGAGKIRAEVAAIIRRKKGDGGWLAPVIMASATKDTGIGDLDDSVERHAAWLAEHRDARATRRERSRYHMRNLLLRRAGEVLDGTPAESFDGALPQLFDRLVAGLMRVG
ncbi:MAG: GTP-binding protein [Alphaproteobacteria bacterium]|jgi:LAO/AO transport system kinase|nr:GTP-binding protein [Alphaproteobacteria bacterium]